MQATIRLFKAVPVEQEIQIKDPDPMLLQETVKRGFVFAPEVWGNYNDTEIENLIKMVEKEVGLTPEQMNSSLHKSWSKVANAPLLQLVLEQLVHYMTTYGYDNIGIYSDESVYIPCEKLDIPDTDLENIRLYVIKGYTKAQLKEKLLKFLGSGIALHDDTIKDAVDVALFTELTGEEIENTSNKEVKSRLYDLLNMVPKNPVEFLRHVIYRSTGKSLLIKDRMTLDAIKDQDNLGVLGLFRIYKNSYGLEKLAEIFLRFKPIFLAFKKGNYELSKIINRIRKLAVKHHKPMKPDFLNDITAIIKTGNTPDLNRLDAELARVNTFRKIRLAYALKFRTKNAESILYRIRNGKGYAKEFDFPYTAAAQTLMNYIVNSIVDDVSKNVGNKKIYIPKYITYTLPATEKMFTGDLPSGTCIHVPKDMIFGIHWENVSEKWVDLDLSVTSPSTGKIGWDGRYRTEGRDILFSGDITSAPKPKGASELFYVKNMNPHELIMFVNYYNYDKDVPVPFKIIVGQEVPGTWGKDPDSYDRASNYTINQNNVLAVAKTTIDQRQKVLGLARSTPNGCEFYFAEAYVGRSITATGAPYNEQTRQYLFNYYTNTISLNDVLVSAGAILVDNKEECEIDLSPETLEKDTIINLLV